MVKRGKVKAKASRGENKELLFENFVLLQKTLVETVTALKQVDRKISDMLELFEEAGRNFKEKKGEIGMASKLSTIEEQNKVIAKTLLLLEKQTREKEKYGIARPLRIGEEEEEPEEKPKKKTTKKKTKSEEEEEEPLFKEEFGEGGEEETEEEKEFKPKPLPEFSF